MEIQQLIVADGEALECLAVSAGLLWLGLLWLGLLWLGLLWLGLLWLGLLWLGRIIICRCQHRHDHLAAL